ncbi:MAG: DUF1294 domain-containing protein [Candidatus Spyradocola sp.]|jgi:uncharacterized membrane protein YsdA (DUF1294 family)
MESGMKLAIYFSALGVLLGMNLAALLTMWADKRRAQRGQSRVRERTLFLLALLFGALGGTAGMFLFRHKTQHLQFRIFFPLLAVVQFALVVWGNAALLVA